MFQLTYKHIAKLLRKVLIILYLFHNLYVPSLLGLWFYHNLIGCHRVLTRWPFVL